MNRLLSAVLVLMGAGKAFCGGPVLLDEPFNYADNAAFNAVWNANPDPYDFYTMDGTFGNPLPSYMMPSPLISLTGRSARNLGGDFNGTDANLLVIAFDFYLWDVGAAALWNGARHYVELRGYSGDAFGVGNLENLLAIGVFFQSNDPFSNAYYQGRVTFASNWSTLDDLGAPGRATGWHRLQIAVTGTQVNFSIDGILAEVESRPNALGFDSVVLGSDLTANGHTAWVDNLTVWTGAGAPLPGDFDGDGDVDLSDFTNFQLCFGGSNNLPAPTCPPGIDADLDGDGDVDLADFLIFQQNFTGSQ